jgi:hypothetical protein
MRVPESSVAIELELARAFRARIVLHDADGYDRFGPRDNPSEREAIERAATQADHARATAIAELERRVPELFATDPASVEAWAEAHVELLDEFLARVSSRTNKAKIARAERAAWLEVRAGVRVWVDQDTAQIDYDPALYEQQFGFLR